jgi:CheY-like chemotaxis protein
MKQSPVQLLTRPQASERREGERKNHKFAARVLVADDNTTNQRVARLMLENLGCRVDVSANGKEAVEMLELLPYDVVFMDCEMPEMDGYEATAEIRRRHDSRRQVPIVAMTAKAIQGDREQCLKSGMDDYISKPVRLEDLEATLGRWFSQPDRGVQSGPEKTPVAVPLAAASPALDPEVTGRLRQLAAATDPAVLAEIYDSYLSSTEEYLAALRQAEQAGDADGLRIAAHSLKGASANVGAPTVAELSRQLEVLGSSQSVAGAAERIGQLTQAFEKVKIEIENQTGKATVG